MSTPVSPLIVGNWKMNLSLTQALAYPPSLGTLPVGCEVGIAVPSLYGLPLLERYKGSLKIYAQNAHWEKAGAFTGEISPLMLKELGFAGSLVAHSERRKGCGETDETAGLRVKALLSEGLEALLCVGEALGEDAQTVLAHQITTALKNIPAGQLGNPTNPLLTIAYEPIWAIGTGQAATPETTEITHRFIRSLITDLWGPDLASHIRILYGGSVTASNISSFMNCPHVNGALVGGASLDPVSFSHLISAAVSAALPPSDPKPA